MTGQLPGAPRLRHLDRDRPSRLAYDTVWIVGVGDFDKPAVADAGANLAVGAALLVELAAAGHVTIAPEPGGDGHRLVPRPQPSVPAESLGLGLVEQIRAEPEPLGVRQWLDYLAVTGIYTRVAEHMTTAGLMRRTEVPQRRGLRRRTQVVYEPVEPLVAGAPFFRLRRWLLDDPTGPIAWTDVFLLGLCEAIGLDHVYHHRSDRARDQSHHQQQQLPEPIRAVLLHLAEAVGAAGTTRRH